MPPAGRDPQDVPARRTATRPGRSVRGSGPGRLRRTWTTGGLTLVVQVLLLPAGELSQAAGGFGSPSD
ncbi:hypothetical protein [Actinomadura xylanilytica]|uniref:hypothetical protein n=1 Tax=Actinomadura xylanilytica TaxID=887459 RepID=UPI00255A8DA1|nr:hypothetical protein [Actinomadura xylanilytica]MDL4774075.1 hypothetical protein [Actinomadura xylanilytica]